MSRIFELLAARAAKQGGASNDSILKSAQPSMCLVTDSDSNPTWSMPIAHSYPSTEGHIYILDAPSLVAVEDGAYVITSAPAGMPALGSDYQITLNGKYYFIKFHDVNMATPNAIYAKAAGNLAALGMQTDASDEPFIVILYDAPENTPDGTTIYGILYSLDGTTPTELKVHGAPEVIVPIAEKYIPDSIARTADIPTDEHINGLINTALGVIENGTY